MATSVRLRLPASALMGLVLCGSATTGARADLGTSAAEVSGASKEWTFAFTPYAWLAFLSGSTRVGSTMLEVDLTPGDLLRNLDWSQVPIWMSYAELRRGPLSFFNDIIWTALEEADGFDRRFVSGKVEVDYRALSVDYSEGAYEYDVLQQGPIAGLTVNF